MSADYAPILTIDELAGYHKIPKSTVYKLAQEGSIPGQKVGRHWRFRRDAIAGLEQGSIDPATKIKGNR